MVCLSGSWPMWMHHLFVQQNEAREGNIIIDPRTTLEFCRYADGNISPHSSRWWPILQVDSRISNIDYRKLDWIDSTLFTEEGQFINAFHLRSSKYLIFQRQIHPIHWCVEKATPCVSWEGSSTYWGRKCQFLRLRSSPLTGCTQWYVLFYTYSKSNVTSPQTTLSWVLCIVVVTALLKLVFTNSWFFFLQPIISVHVETKLLLTARNFILISWFYLSKRPWTSSTAFVLC